MGNDVEKLLNAAPIEIYIQKYVTLTRKGKNYWGLCPFHNEKTPSFSVSPEKSIYKCFGCGKGGNLLTFIQDYERKTFVEALETLSEQTGIPLEKTKFDKKNKNSKTKSKKEQGFYINNWVLKVFQSHIQDKIAQEYLQKRQLKSEVISAFQLGYAPPDYRFLENQLHKTTTSSNQSNDKNIEIEKKQIDLLHELGLLGKSTYNDESYNRFKDRLIFPIKDASSRCIGFGGRILHPKENTGKYVNSPESFLFLKKNNLYNLDKAKDYIRKEKMAIVVEGYFDVIGLYQADIKNVVAPLGTAFTTEQARIIKMYTDTVLLFFDNDQAGINASYKSLLILRSAKINIKIVISEILEAKDPFDLALEKDKTELLILIDNAKNELQFILWYFFRFKYNINSLEEKRQAINEFFENIVELEEDWVKQEYIKKAAGFLSIEFNALLKDYLQKEKTIHHKNIPYNTDLNSQTTNENFLEENFDIPTSLNEREKKVPRLEQEILFLLLKHNFLWQKELLINEIKWKHQKMYLLFSFFRDRLKTGETWGWQNLSKTIDILPEELSQILTGLIIEYDEVESSKEVDKEDIIDLFSHLIKEHKVITLNMAIAKLKNKLEDEERIQGNQIDELTEKLIVLIEKKNELKNAK